MLNIENKFDCNYNKVKNSEKVKSDHCRIYVMRLPILSVKFMHKNPCFKLGKSNFTSILKIIFKIHEKLQTDSHFLYIF